MGESPPTANEFATAMQQLSAEAEKTLPPELIQTRRAAARAKTVAESSEGTSTGQLDDRLKNLERALTQKIEGLVAEISQNKTQDMTLRFGKIDEQLTAIRNSESVNQRLFDSLHDELIKYRDNFVHESLQKPFIHDLVHLFDDLTSLAEQLRTAAESQKKAGHVTQWRDNLDNAVHSLVEILHRFDVVEVEPKENVDRAVHRVVNFEPADFPEEDGRIVMRLKRGFLWRGRLIRPEEVIAKRYG